MREILFRGKRIDNGKWWYGLPLRTLSKDGEDVLNIQCWERDKEGITGLYNAVIPATVGQFAGLTDKNGKRIFEGDIGRYKQTDGAKRNGSPITCIGKVIYNTKTASYAVESNDESGCKYFDYFPIKGFEVIGNIHDNPELLEVVE